MIVTTLSSSTVVGAVGKIVGIFRGLYCFCFYPVKVSERVNDGSSRRKHVPPNMTTTTTFFELFGSIRTLLTTPVILPSKNAKPPTHKGPPRCRNAEECGSLLGPWEEERSVLIGHRSCRNDLKFTDHPRSRRGCTRTSGAKRRLSGGGALPLPAMCRNSVHSFATWESPEE